MRQTLGKSRQSDYYSSRYAKNCPMPDLIVKICGLKDADNLQVALEAGADMIGLVSFEKSPRHVTLNQGEELARLARGRASIVALSVNAEDAHLEDICQQWDPDYLQLHGSETPQRVEQVKSLFGKPVIKALGIGEMNDLQAIERYRPLCDFVLLDARPPAGATRPGGLGKVFNWSLLEQVEDRLKLMLSGGLTPANVRQALSCTGLAALDVSSGVETSPGRKNADLIRQFIENARLAGHDALETITSD
jgi:phosphoribosylanthranilate isomerase